MVREIADMASESGLKVALYPHWGLWLEKLEDAIRITKEVHRRNVGVTFNLCHWLAVTDVENEKELEPLLTQAKPYLFAVTINGADNKPGWRNLIQTLDQGSFDTYNLLKILKKLGYTGPIGLQGYGIRGDVRENLTRSIRAWRKLADRIAGESDAWGKNQ